MPNQGEVVLIPIPFTDLTSSKRRPAIVISNNTFNKSTRDLVIVGMTTQPANNPWTFTLTPADMATGALNQSGQVRIDKVFNLAQAIVVKSFGMVRQSILEKIKHLMMDFIQTGTASGKENTPAGEQAPGG